MHSRLCIRTCYRFLLTYIHDALSYTHNRKPMCSFHRYILHPTCIFTVKISQFGFIHNPSHVMLKGVIICLLLWQERIFSHLAFHLIILLLPEEMEYIPLGLLFGTKLSWLPRMESAMPPWYLFNLDKSNTCFMFYSSGKSYWASSILLLFHYTCALLSRLISFIPYQY